MVILDFIQRNPNCQTTLEYYYDSPFCNHGQLELRTIKTNAGNHHLIILQMQICWYIGIGLGL